MGNKRNAAKQLRLWANRLDRCGWIQGNFGNRRTGYCVVGVTLAGPSPSGMDHSYATRFLAKRALLFVATGRTYDVHSLLFDWNDRPGQTKKNVISTMRKTARLLEHGLKVPSDDQS